MPTILVGPYSQVQAEAKDIVQAVAKVNDSNTKGHQRKHGEAS